MGLGDRRGGEGASLPGGGDGIKGLREKAGIGVKPTSPYGTKRHVEKSIRYALDRGLPTLTLVHKGNITKYTEGAFRD